MALIDLTNCLPEDATGKRGFLPKQQQFVDAVLNQKEYPYVMYSGGMGSGKTLVGCMTTLILAVLYPGDYLVSRLYNPELKLTTYKTFLDICPPELIIEHRVADQIIKLRSQGGKVSEIIFRGLDEPEKHKSLNLNAVYIDEASQVSESAFTLLQGRLRGKHVRKIYCTTNPGGHSFLYRYFVKKDWPNEEIKRKFLHISAPSTENTHLPEGYVENMLATWSKDRIDRDVMGSWDSFAGQVYTEFSRNVHVVKPFRIPDEWEKSIGMDHGFVNPTCALWGATDYDGNMYIYREFYEKEWTIQEICKGKHGGGAKGIVDLSKGEKVRDIFIDPSTKANRGRGSDYENYLDHLPKDWTLHTAVNEVTAGIDRVKEYLKVSPKSGKPRLFVFDNCPNLVDELIKYRWKESAPGAIDLINPKEEPVKKDDHAADALRYLIMSRPESPKMDDKAKAKRQEHSMESAILRELYAIKHPEPKDIFGDY